MLSGTLSPSRPDPYMVLLSASPPLLFVWSVRRRRVLVFFFFFLSLRRWGNPNPPRGFGVPLVFLHPAQALRLRPVLRARHLHHGHAPHLFFFFSSSSSLVFWFGVWLSVVVAFSFLFVVFQERKLRANRTHPTRALCFCSFFFVPRRTWFSSRFGRASFLSGVLSGCHSGPRAFFGFSRDSSEALSWARGGMGASCHFSFCRVLFFPFCVVCGCTRFPSRPE